MSRFKKITAVMAAALMLAGCGSNIPEIDPALLQSKPSVMVVTDAGVPDAAETQLAEALADWQSRKLLSYEWIRDASQLTPEQLEKARTQPYDYILVAGHELVKNTLQPASEITQRRWLLLDDSLLREAVSASGNHMAVKIFSDDQFRQQWDPWVREQQSAGRTIEWVTTSSYPIPSEWAPSEEAEYISLADAEGWFTPFQSQLRRHSPAWIAVYAPLEETMLQRIRGTQIPVMNMAGTRIELQWSGILASLQELLEGKEWTPGVQPYKETEARIIRN